MKNLFETIKIIIFSPFGLIVSFLTIVGYYLYYEGINNEQKAIYFVNKTEYNAVIIDKYFPDSTNQKGGITIFVDIITQDTVKYLHNIYSGQHSGLFEYIQIGDTILKSKGEGKITIKKTSGEEREFKYNSTLFPNIE